MSPFEFIPPSDADRPYTISEINDGIADIIESANTLVWIEGEISNWKGAGSSGHCYFRLKDDESQVPSVMWKTTASQLTFKPKDGMAIVAVASIRVYRKGGYYQLDVHRMQEIGSGALFLAFEKLKTKLDKEGLFDESAKKQLPESVRTLGVITSKQGAVIRDIARVVLSRAPQTDILLIDVPVQGEKAAIEIVKAIERMNEYERVDCMIVGRGGGSIEDLWAFNDEAVARAIYNSEIPVISAVGHETDFTIADFAADIRAATPSAAAEMAVADNRQNRYYFDSCIDRFTNLSRNYFEYVTERFNNAATDPALKVPLRLLKNGVQNLDEHEERCRRSMKILFERATYRFSSSGSRLNALSPLEVLSRGYSVVTDGNGQSIRSTEQLVVDEKVKIIFSKGTAEARIQSLSPQNGEFSGEKVIDKAATTAE